MKMLEKKIGIYDEMIATGVDLFNPLNTQDYNCKEK